MAETNHHWLGSGKGLAAGEREREEVRRAEGLLHRKLATSAKAQLLL